MLLQNQQLLAFRCTVKTARWHVLCNCSSPIQIPLTTWKVKDRPWGFQEAQAPRFQDNRYMMVTSALRTGRLYSQEIFLVLISVRGCVDPKAICGRKHYVYERFKMTPSGIEPATFLLVAQCLFTQLCHRATTSKHRTNSGETCHNLLDENNMWIGWN